MESCLHQLILQNVSAEITELFGTIRMQTMGHFQSTINYGGSVLRMQRSKRKPTLLKNTKI